jgi:hypothetical protein
MPTWKRIGLRRLLVLFLIVSCTQDAPLAVRPARWGPLRPSFSAAWPGGSYSFSPTTSNDTIPRYADSLPYDMVVHVTGSGTISGHETNWFPTQPVKDSFVLDVRGRYYGGYCFFNVELSSQDGPLVWCNSSPSSLLLDTAITVGGKTRLIWGPRIFTNSTDYDGGHTCGPGSSLPCYDIEGELTVTVTPATAILFVTSTQQHGAMLPGATIYDTAKITPATYRSLSLPFTVLHWDWQPDDDDLVNDQCSPGSSTCVLTPSTSGVLIAQGVANGELQTAYVRVRVVPSGCDSLLSDSVLNDPTLRQGLREALAASNPGASWASLERQERNGIIWRAPSGRIYIQDVSDPGNTPCWSMDPSSLPPADTTGSTFIGYFHTHPNVRGDSVLGCQPGANGQMPAQVYGDTNLDGSARRAASARGCDANGGGSDDDWNMTEARGVHYIICADGRVVRLDPGTTRRKKNPNKWYWNRPGCTWPA